MQRKQQVGECWVCVIFFACVCVWACQIRQLLDFAFSNGFWVDFGQFLLFFLLFLADL
jgi:hypothetical protein